MNRPDSVGAMQKRPLTSSAGGTHQNHSFVWGAHDRPPTTTLVVNAIQHTSLIALSLIVSTVVLREAGLEGDALRRQIGLIAISLALVNVLVSRRWGMLGAGLLLPVQTSAVFLVPALVAAREGGLALIVGMTVFSGILLMLLAPLLPRLRHFFPAEIAGLVIMIIGLDLSLIGQTYMMVPFEGVMSPGTSMVIGIATIATVVILSVWVGGRSANYTILLGLMIGCLGTVILSKAGLVTLTIPAFPQVLAIPASPVYGTQFSAGLVAIYTISTLAVAMSLMGNITIAQQISTPNWVRPNMHSIRGGILASGLGLVASGLAGCHGVTASSSNIGLSKATGVMSISVIYVVAAMLVVLGFSPLLLELILQVPRPVTGAIWLILGAYVLIGGLQITTSRILDVRRGLVIGLALPIGLSAKVYPEVFASLPEMLRPLTDSTLVLGTVTAIALNAIFRLGVRQRAETVLDDAGSDAASIQGFMKRQGGLWAARPEVIDRATFALAQLAELMRDSRPDAKEIRIAAEFDEFNLRLYVRYQGEPLVFPTRRPSPRQIVSEENGTELLAGYLVRNSADVIDVTTTDGETTVFLSFDH